MATKIQNLLEIKIPSLYKDVIPLGLENLSILHAPLNCRIKETILADLFRDIVSTEFDGKDFVFLTQDANRIRNMFHSWIVSYYRFSAKAKTKGFIFENGSTIWILNPKDINPDDLLFTKLYRCVICDAHAIQQQIYDLLERISTYIVCVGNKTTRDHWFYKFNRESTSCLFDAVEILDAFPDQQQELDRLRESYNHNERSRYLDLQDVEIRHPNFSRFASSRLFIKTDRDIRSLHPEQQKFAKETEGTPIVPYYLTALNKRYLAMKRLAKKQGKKARFLLLKYRRGGFTTLEQGLSYHQCVEFPYSQCITLAHTRSEEHTSELQSH